MPKTATKKLSFTMNLRLTAEQKGHLDYLAKKKGLTTQNAIRTLLKEAADSLRRQLASS